MPSKKKWPGAVTQHSNALDPEKHVLDKDDPKDIARSLRRSAEHSTPQKLAAEFGRT